MVGTPVAIGPFFGGLNSVNDPSTIEENQCSTLQNFDIDIDGSLVTRPSVIAETFLPGAWAHHFLCTYAIAGQTYAISSRRSGSGEALTAFDVKTGVATTIVTNSAYVKYTDAVQYLDKVWFIAADAGGNGGSWSPLGAVTGYSGMPRGIATVIYKERMFIASPTGRIYFSKVAQFDQWEASGFYDVSPGDGQEIKAMIVHMGQIVIFKDHSTYVLAYDAAPESAQLQMVSGDFGTTSPQSVVVHENLIYTFHNNNLYAINNWRWQNVSMNVNIFEPSITTRSPEEYRTGIASLSSIGRRIVVRYRTSYWTYFPDLESWVTWVPPTDPSPVEWTWDRWLELPGSHPTGYKEYWAGTFVQTTELGVNILTTDKTYRLIDGHPPLPEIFASTDFKAIVASKQYDLDMPYNFKRLHWWGVDILARSLLSARVFPETYNKQITWAEFNAMGKTWDQLAAEGRTWDRLADSSVVVEDSYMFGHSVGIKS